MRPNLLFSEEHDYLHNGFATKHLEIFHFFSLFLHLQKNSLKNWTNSPSSTDQHKDDNGRFSKGLWYPLVDKRFVGEKTL